MSYRYRKTRESIELKELREELKAVKSELVKMQEKQFKSRFKRFCKNAVEKAAAIGNKGAEFKQKVEGFISAKYQNTKDSVIRLNDKVDEFFNNIDVTIDDKVKKTGAFIQDKVTDVQIASYNTMDKLSEKLEENHVKVSDKANEKRAKKEKKKELKERMKTMEKLLNERDEKEFEREKDIEDIAKRFKTIEKEKNPSKAREFMNKGKKVLKNYVKGTTLLVDSLKASPDKEKVMAYKKDLVTKEKTKLIMFEKAVSRYENEVGEVIQPIDEYTAHYYATKDAEPITINMETATEIKNQLKQNIVKEEYENHFDEKGISKLSQEELDSVHLSRTKDRELDEIANKLGKKDVQKEQTKEAAELFGLTKAMKKVGKLLGIGEKNAEKEKQKQKVVSREL